MEKSQNNLYIYKSYNISQNHMNCINKIQDFNVNFDLTKVFLSSRYQRRNIGVMTVHRINCKITRGTTKNCKNHKLQGIIYKYTHKCLRDQNRAIGNKSDQNQRKRCWNCNILVKSNFHTHNRHRRSYAKSKVLENLANPPTPILTSVCFPMWQDRRQTPSGTTSSRGPRSS